MRTIAAWLALLVLVGFVAVACGGGSRGSGTPGPSNGSPAAGASAAATPRKSWAGKDPAPDIPGGLTWFNVTRPLTLADLRGKVVVLDFWTLGCINCQHVIPDLKQLEAEFGDALAVVGVHSGKYATEHDDESVRDAIRRFGLTHPVVNDPDFAAWDAYGARAWPTLAIIDPAGNMVGMHAGEGVYELFQPIIASLVAEFDAKGQVRRDALPLQLDTTAHASVLSQPSDVAVDSTGGRLFIADAGHNRVLVASTDGRLERVIGSGTEGFADGAAGEAAFRQPQGLALSNDGGTLFVADTRNHAIRAVDLATFEVTTIAGTGKQADRLPVRESDALKTALASPWDLVDVRGTLYIAMAGVHQLWALNVAKKTIAVYAGTSREGIDDGPRLEGATLAQPSGITSDGDVLYWVDPESSSVRQLRLGGTEQEVETITGTGLFDYGDKDGQGKLARLQHAQGIALGDGELFVADTYNHRLRTIDLVSHAVRTYAGSTRGWSDGYGDAARFDEPGGLAFARGKLYVADTNNDLVRVVDAHSGEVSTLTLTNLDVAKPAAPGRRQQVQLEPQAVAPGAGSIRVTVKAPAGHHLNSSGPSQLQLSSSNPQVLEAGEQLLSWSSDEAQVSFPVPVELRDGSATLTAQASIYYCREGEEALCFIQQVELSLPVTVTAGATAGEVRLEYELPPG